jgi:HEAT repeat protein
MAANPLLLSMLVQVSRAGQLPRNRGQLFRKFTKQSLDREAAKGHPVSVPPTVVEEVLAKTAVIMQERKTLQVPGADFTEIVRSCISLLDEDLTSASVRDFAISAGLLRRVGRSILFTHQSYQEYFTAAALNDRLIKDGKLTRRVEVLDKTWVEPLLLLAGICTHPDDLVVQLTERDPILAVKAITNGACIDDESTRLVIERLRLLSTSTSWIDRRNSADLAGELGSPLGHAVLEPLLRDEHQEVRWGAVHALATIGERGDACNQLILSLNDPYWVVRGEACLALATLDIYEAADALVGVLSSNEMYERGCAAEALIRMLRGPNSALLDQNLEGLADALPGSVRNLLHLVLRVGRSMDPLHEVRHLLKDSTPEATQVAIRLAISSQDSGSIPELTALLVDENAEVRTAAASALGKLMARGTMDLLANTARTDLSGTVRATAATALGELGAIEAAAPLVAVLSEDPDEEVRFSAARSLGRLQAPEALQALSLALAFDSDARVRAHAARSIGFLGTSAGRSVLSNCLDSEADEDVKASIAEALSNLAVGHRYVRY